MCLLCGEVVVDVFMFDGLCEFGKCYDFGDELVGFGFDFDGGGWYCVVLVGVDC